jgi:L-asparagine transporter-like permease
MPFYKRISWISLIMFFIIVLAMIFPSNLTIFLATIFTGGLMIYLVLLVLKDERPEPGDYPIKD